MLFLLIALQVGSEAGFEKNFVPIIGSILSPEITPYQRLGFKVGLGYTYYHYYPYDKDFPYLPDFRLNVSYRIYNGRTPNPLVRSLLATRIIGRAGVYPEQRGTGRHLPYFVLGLGITLTDESVFIPKLAVNIMATRVRSMTVLPTDPYYQVKIDRCDAYLIDLEVRKLIGRFQFAVFPIYLRSKIKGTHRGYIGTEELERSPLTGISDLYFDRSITRSGVGGSLTFGRLTFSLSYSSFWNFTLNYWIHG